MVLGPYKERIIRYEEDGRIIEFMFTPKPGGRLFFHVRRTNLHETVLTSVDGYLVQATAKRIRDQLTTWLEAQGEGGG